MVRPVLVLGFLVAVSLLALFTQQRATLAQQTLRERLQQPSSQSAQQQLHQMLDEHFDIATVVTAVRLDERAAASNDTRRGAPTVPSVGHVHHDISSSPPPPPSPPVDSCPGRRRPYHVVLTAASGIYQEWQTRVAYYHYRQLKAQNPCSDIGDFTRLLNTPNAQPDGLTEEIPTVLVSQLSYGRCEQCDHGFIVMNRPWGLRQFTRLREFAQIREDYLFIVETDHLLLRPLPNEASPTRPVGFGFYYMTYRYDPPKLRPVIARYHDPEQVDAVGPSPVIIHKQQLVSLVDSWWQMCLTLKRDSQADRAFGWVLEMWGYALASARLGIRHKIERSLQAEPGGAGIRNLDAYYIYHYTFDLDIKASFLSRSPWAWSKRRFMSGYPPLLTPPPNAAQRSTHTFVRMMNEGIVASKPWRPLVRPKR